MSSIIIEVPRHRATHNVVGYPQPFLLHWWDGNFLAKLRVVTSLLPWTMSFLKMPMNVIFPMYVWAEFALDWNIGTRFLGGHFRSSMNPWNCRPLGMSNTPFRFVLRHNICHSCSIDHKNRKDMASQGPVVSEPFTWSWEREWPLSSLGKNMI